MTSFEQNVQLYEVLRRDLEINSVNLGELMWMHPLRSERQVQPASGTPIARAPEWTALMPMPPKTPLMRRLEPA
ncbi:hypothetical protein [Rhizobacter sp. OV335]|uniref:hypothetical protein n=1 Tax=Rhizobacter sp. OV335 TaxID=1500264 RepID=UPI0011610D4D|nr:hypothetical protein [Rhizobacter sp. OV335]